MSDKKYIRQIHNFYQNMKSKFPTKNYSLGYRRTTLKSKLV